MARNFGSFLAVILTCCLPGFAQSGLGQAPFSYAYNEEPDNSNLILASLHSLLRSWSQAYAPHGHAIVPVIVNPGTLLYHMGTKRPPRYMEWFAFDAEHSYIFGGGWRGTPAGDRTLYTFAASRPLRALYFDGFSAAKTWEGTLDMQDILVYGKLSNINDSRISHDDYGRGLLLCEWGKEFGIEGFVREEATFELLWCDFQNGVQQLDATDVTMPPSSPESAPLMPPRNSFWMNSLEKKGHPQHCTIDEPWDMLSPYAAQAMWSFYHAASWHHRAPEIRITLHPAYMVSLYDPSYSSLAANNKLPVRKHRLIDLSPEDVTAFKAEAMQALTAWRDDQYGLVGSGIDWFSIAQAVVDRNGDRISEMRQILGNVSLSSNVTEAVAHVRLVAFALVMPYVDHVSVLSSNTSREARSSSLARTTDHCSTAFTRHLKEPLVKLTAQERRLKKAIEGVLEKICKFGTSVLGDSLTLLELLEDVSREGGQDNGRQMLKAWADNVEHLMNWLGWAMWQRCPRACDWDVRFVSGLHDDKGVTSFVHKNNAMCPCGPY